MGMTFNNLCDSCTNIGCEFQSGIVRTECAFYMPPHLEVDAISRADAIKAMQDKAKELKNEDTINGLCGAVAILFDMPSVTPQESTTKNDLGVDCVARQDVERFIEGFINEYTPEEELEFINLELNGLKHLPSVTPQEPQTFKWCTDCKEHDQEKHCCHRYSKVIRDTVEEMKEVYIKREVLDKIRAQIKSNLRGVEITLEVLNENHPLRLKMAGAKDTLEDCLEIINKAESEG